MKRVFLALVAAFDCVFAASEVPATTGAVVTQQTCPSSATGLDARCVIASLPLGGANGGDRTVRVEAVILPALGKRTKEAVFILEGGPGLRASDAAQEFARDWRALRASRDLVIFNTRGVGADGLFCQPVNDEEQRAAYSTEIFPADLLKRCRVELERKTDVTRFTSTIMAEDMERMRQALGYSRISLIGYSYGTRLAQEYLRLFPDRTASAVLLGAVRMDAAYPSGLAPETEAVFDMVIADCARDPACKAAFPELRRDRDAMLRKLSAEGLRARVSYGGSLHDVRISPGIVTSWLRSRLYAMETAMAVPKLIHELAADDSEAIAQSIIDSQRSIYDTTAVGLWLSLTCAEDVAFVDLEKSRIRAKNTSTGDSRLVEQVGICASWPQSPLRRAFREPVRSSVPVLIVSGDYDPATRPDDAKLILQGFKHGAWLLIPNESHILRADWDQCIGALASDFVKNGGWQARRPDTSCAARTRRPSFVLPQ